jgi:DNA-binding response OmpR family regulator
MTRKLKIVVADDERDTREYLQDYLSRIGYDVRAAADGRQLVELCRAFGPDLVVTDYAMPGLNGLAAAAEANRDRAVPVIVISGRHDVESRAQADGSCVVRFLAKPVKELELRGAVEAALRNETALEATPEK